MLGKKPNPMINFTLFCIGNEDYNYFIGIITTGVFLFKMNTRKKIKFEKLFIDILRDLLSVCFLSVGI